jgi:hypothetical protein
MTAAAASWMLAIVTAGVQGPPGQPSRAGLYAADPNHLWNRVHHVFHVRTAPDGSEYGFDDVDPLLWRETKYLLTKRSHARAIAVLDEFLASDRILRPNTFVDTSHERWARWFTQAIVAADAKSRTYEWGCSRDCG